MRAEDPWICRQFWKANSEYAALKNEKVAGREIAKGVRIAYEPLFAANENVNNLEGQELRGLIAQVAGSDGPTTTKIQGTFKALAALADFDAEGHHHARAGISEAAEDSSSFERASR